MNIIQCNPSTTKRGVGPWPGVHMHGIRKEKLFKKKRSGFKRGERGVSHQGGLLSGWALKMTVSHQGSFSSVQFLSGWSFIVAVFHHGSLSLWQFLIRWSLISVVFHQGGSTVLFSSFSLFLSQGI